MDRDKKEGLAILISDRIDYKKRAIKRDPEVTSQYSKEESTKKT